ncbi:hypothetical protein ACD578_25740 [Microvirga sp. RSM25]|uniref:hypothetical protein n=1 Tax=Microvirga sp. RSM25 TaxID=3273802 RepID=UPI00384DA756
MGAIYYERAIKSVQSIRPDLLDPRLFHLENQALDRKAGQLRGWAAHLLATVIPSKVRRELLKGNHLITGRNNAGERVPITIDDLASLEIDLSSHSLIGPAAAYTGVSVRPVEGQCSTELPHELGQEADTSEAPTSRDCRPGPKPPHEKSLKVLVAEIAFELVEAQAPKTPRGWRTAIHGQIAGRLAKDYPKLSRSVIEKYSRYTLDQWEFGPSGK